MFWNIWENASNDGLNSASRYYFLLTNATTSYFTAKGLKNMISANIEWRNTNALFNPFVFDKKTVVAQFQEEDGEIVLVNFPLFVQIHIWHHDLDCILIDFLMLFQEDGEEGIELLCIQVCGIVFGKFLKDLVHFSFEHLIDCLPGLRFSQYKAPWLAEDAIFSDCFDVSHFGHTQICH